jgi:hypothetical protein
MASLDFVEWNNDIFKENDVLFSQGHSETWNNACKNIKQLRCTIELESFVNQTVEAIINCFPYHFPSRHKLCVKSV